MKKWTSELIELYRDDIVTRRDKKLCDILGEETIFPEGSPFFLNDNYLRNSGISIELSDGEKEELIKIINFPNYIFRYSSITPYLFQSQLFDELFKERFVLIRHGRQLGISNIVNHFILNQVLSTKSETLVICNKPLLEFQKFLEILRRIPIIYQVGISKSGQLSINWENGSSLRFLSYNKLTIDRNYDNIIILDASHCKDLSNILNSIVPTISARTSGRIIMEGNISLKPSFFNELCAGKFPFKEKIIDSLSVPNRDQNWINREIKNIGGLEYFLTEYMCLIPGTKEWNREINLHKLLDE
jgi:hypothetical protein